MSEKYWLMKSEPKVFSITDLKKSKRTLWDGIRNYQARNFMMKEMSLGDAVLFYHSNAEPPGIAGLAKVSQLAQPDPTALQPQSKYFEPRATRDNPIWYCVEISFVRQFPQLIPLNELRNIEQLKNMVLLKKGSRLSIQPVQPVEFKKILELAERHTLT